MGTNSDNESNPPNLLTLPSELRLKIFTLALFPPTDRPPAKEDFNPLLTSHQIYYEIRDLPPQLYPAGLSYEASTPRLAQLIPTLHQPWQIANLRRLEIRWLYPSHLPTFLGVDIGIHTPSKTSNSENASPPSNSSGRRFLLQDPSLNLDILKIYTDDWMTKASSSQWRRTASTTDVQYGMPGPSCGWLVALCQLQGFKQLELVFPDARLAQEYWERGRFLEPLLGNFAEAMKSEDRPPEWTAWHKWTPDEDFGERVSVLRTRDLHLHRYPQWGREDLDTLRQGGTCVHPGFEKGSVLVEGGAGRGGLFAEIDPPSFHVRELLGDPKTRKKVCGLCSGMGAVA